MAIEKELLDQLLVGRDPAEVFAKDGLLDDLKKALSERLLNTEFDEHLEDEWAEGNVNRRNGHSKKTVLTGTSKMTLSIPRDRAGSFDPKLIAKYQRRFPDFDHKIISMYARGMTVREIRGHLKCPINNFQTGSQNAPLPPSPAISRSGWPAPSQSAWSEHPSSASATISSLGTAVTGHRGEQQKRFVARSQECRQAGEMVQGKAGPAFWAGR